jgi:hypothetical protein
MDEPVTTATSCARFSDPRGTNVLARKLGYPNDDGTVTPHLRQKTELQLIIIAGMHAACTGHEYRNRVRKNGTLLRDFTDCQCSFSGAMHTLHKLIDNCHESELRDRFCSDTKILCETVYPEDKTKTPYFRHTVVLRHKRTDVVRCVSFVLCGSSKRCRIYVTANTAEDTNRWMHSHQHHLVDIHGSIWRWMDPRLRAATQSIK